MKTISNLIEKFQEVKQELVKAVQDDRPKAKYVGTTEDGYHHYDVHTHDGKLFTHVKHNPKHGDTEWDSFGDAEKDMSPEHQEHVVNTVLDHAKTIGTGVKDMKKGVNESYNATNSNTSATPLAMGEEGFKTEKIEIAKNGQWSLNKVDPQENVNIPHPQKPPKMMDPTPQGKDSKKIHVAGNPHSGVEKAEEHTKFPSVDQPKIGEHGHQIIPPIKTPKIGEHGHQINPPVKKPEIGEHGHQINPPVKKPITR